jgi:site-specific DNA recombinase
MVTQVALYARVSSEMQVEGFSIEAQLRAMREFARDQRWEIVREYIEEGFTAGTDARPQFQILLRDARLRLFDGLLVHKLDRLYRNLTQLLELVNSLEQQGITLISVTERVDFSTPSGKMLLTNIGMISEFYLNNLREETTKGKYQRALCGLWNGDIPFGYCKGLCRRCDDPQGQGYCPNYGQPDKTDGKCLIAHPKDSVGLRLSFEWHITGKQSDYDVATRLNEHGYRTRCKLTRKADPENPGGSKLFGKETVRSMLQNPFYLGYVKYKGQLLKGTHPALITQEMFDASQEIRRRWHRNPAQRRAHPRVFPLTGVLRCALCGFPMRGTTDDETRYYRDTAREHAATCPRRGLLLAERIERAVMEQVGQIVLPETWKTRIAQLATATPERGRLDEQRRLIHSQLERLQKLFVQGDLAEEEYDKRKARLHNELKQVAAQEPTPTLPAQSIAPTMRYFLEHATPEETKRIYRMLFRAVWVGEQIERLEFRKPFSDLLGHTPNSPAHHALSS